MAKIKESKKKVVPEVKLADMSASELKLKAGELRKKLTRLKLELRAGKAKNTREGYMTRKQLARVLSALGSKLE
jgi:ribosomal protein L29